MAVIGTGLVAPQANAAAKDIHQQILDALAAAGTKLTNIDTAVRDLTDNNGGSQIIRFQVATQGVKSADCTSDEDFKLYVTGYGQELDRIQVDAGTTTLAYILAGESIIVGGQAGETLTVTARHLADDGQVGATITLETAEGAIASCTLAS